MKTKIIILTLLTIILWSCNKDENIDNDNDSYGKGGIFIVSEGNYSSANSSLSYYDPLSGNIENNIFYKANKAPLGDVAQSIVFHDNKAYITINNSGHIYAINSEDGTFVGKIDNLISPRNLLVVNNNKAYVSDLLSTSLTIVNPSTFNKTGSINIGRTSEAMVKSDNLVFVSNWSGYNQEVTNNMVVVIDPVTDAIIDSITVGLEPESMVIDKNNFLWVLCSGGFMNDENPTLWKINISTLSVDTSFTFDKLDSNPTNLKITQTGDTLYFLNDGVYSLSVSSASLPTIPTIESLDNNFYALGISSNGDLYISDALDYVRNGKIFRYSNTGDLLDTFDAGIIPGCIESYN